MYKLKAATLTDADMLSKLWVATFTQAYAGVHTSENIAAYCEDNFAPNQALNVLSDKGTTCVIAFRNAVETGFYVIKDNACPAALEGKSVELKQIYVLESGYGQGLGKLLFKDAMKAARGLNAHWLWLSVSDINHRAQAFYKKLGFEVAGTGPTFNVGSDRLTSTVMTKRVKSTA